MRKSHNNNILPDEQGDLRQDKQGGGALVEPEYDIEHGGSRLGLMMVLLLLLSGQKRKYILLSLVALVFWSLLPWSAFVL